MWSGYGPTRTAMLSQLQDAANRLGFGGTLVWAVYAWPVSGGTRQYNFAFNEDGGPAVEKQWAAAAAGAVSGAPGAGAPPTPKCGDVTPPGGWTCEQQKCFNACGASWMTSGGFCARTCGRCRPGAVRADGTEAVDDGAVSVQSAVSEGG